MSTAAKSRLPLPVCFPIRISWKRLAARRPPAAFGPHFLFSICTHLEDDFQTSVASNNKTLRRVFISACEQDAPNLNIGEAVSWDGSVVTLAKSDSLPLEVRAAIADG